MTWKLDMIWQLVKLHPIFHSKSEKAEKAYVSAILRSGAPFLNDGEAGSTGYYRLNGDHYENTTGIIWTCPEEYQHLLIRDHLSDLQPIRQNPLPRADSPGEIKLELDVHDISSKPQKK